VKITDSLLVLFTFTLWLATRDLVTGAKDTAERQLRVYVFVKEAFIRNLDGPDAPTVHIYIINFGQTPAYKFRMSGALKYFSFPHTEFSRDPTGDQRILETILPPGGQLAYVQDMQVVITPEIKAALKAGQTAIYAFGEVTYIDIFKNTRTLKFRQMFGGDIGTRIIERDGISLGAMAQTIEGNSTDDE
jgi:hypothetical protein